MSLGHVGLIAMVPLAPREPAQDTLATDGLRLRPTRTVSFTASEDTPTLMARPRALPFRGFVEDEPVRRGNHR